MLGADAAEQSGILEDQHSWAGSLQRRGSPVSAGFGLGGRRALTWQCGPCLRPYISGLLALARGYHLACVAAVGPGFFLLGRPVTWGGASPPSPQFFSLVYRDWVRECSFFTHALPFSSFTVGSQGGTFCLGAPWLGAYMEGTFFVGAHLQYWSLGAIWILEVPSCPRE